MVGPFRPRPPAPLKRLASKREFVELAGPIIQPMSPIKPLSPKGPAIGGDAKQAQLLQRLDTIEEQIQQLSANVQKLHKDMAELFAFTKKGIEQTRRDLAMAHADLLAGQASAFAADVPQQTLADGEAILKLQQGNK